MRTIKFLFFCLLAIGFSACDKHNLSQTHSIEGYLYKGGEESAPRVNFHLAVSQDDKGEKNAPDTYTDSNGYFKIVYTSTNRSKYITLHRYSDDYCIFSDVVILKNLPKGQNLNLGKVYY